MLNSLEIIVIEKEFRHSFVRFQARRYGVCTYIIPGFKPQENVYRLDKFSKSYWIPGLKGRGTEHRRENERRRPQDGELNSSIESQNGVEEDEAEGSIGKVVFCHRRSEKLTWISHPLAVELYNCLYGQFIIVIVSV
ncbi:hypothetical protein LIER_01845 [Lithospermum erythrorhizon]|uniref:Uncharacterized protein n=1 Tax=Lithospermum erythrorhizon TaxID=34254 RepID=A0AAV3NMH9_LITER